MKIKTIMDEQTIKNEKSGKIKKQNLRMRLHIDRHSIFSLSNKTKGKLITTLVGL